jgi:AraC-like DNA-binding protein
MPQPADDHAPQGPTNSRIDEWFRLSDAAKLSVPAVGRSRLAVTEIRYDRPGFGMTEQVQPEDAFLLALRLKPSSMFEVWVEGKAVPVYDTRVGDAALFDLKTVNAARYVEPVHSLQFFLPRSFLNELCDDLEAPRIDQLDATTGRSIRDPVVRRLGHAVRPALAAPHESTELFASQMMLALGIYVCAIKGNLRAPRRQPGGLSAWQTRVAKEMINAHLDGNIPLQRIAEVCGVSTSHFAHAFKRTVGVAPHRWLLQRRLDRATTLLRSGGDSLINIALACGFADQSHFTRVFRAATGQTPGAWRQMLN